MEASDYPNGTAPRSVLFYVEGMWLSREMVPRIRFVADFIRSRGGHFNGTEGYRWLGVPDDRVIGRTGSGASTTSDGTSNQQYQKGREDSGFTPSAAPVGTSNHGKGKSVDTNTDRMDLRDEAFRLVGMKRDISSETWHGTIVGSPLVDLSKYEIGYAGTPVAPTPELPKDETDEDVINLFIAKDDHGFIFEGWSFIQAEDGTLRALSAVEYTKFKFHESQGTLKLAEAYWAGADIYLLALQLGLWEFVGTKEEGPRGLTGRLIGRNAPIDGSEPRDGSEDRHTV